MTVFRTFPVLLVAWSTANEIVTMSERRFNEAEVAEIFRAAAELENASPKALARVDGMTLAELQQIGEEIVFPDMGYYYQLVRREKLSASRNFFSWLKQIADAHA